MGVLANDCGEYLGARSHSNCYCGAQVVPTWPLCEAWSICPSITICSFITIYTLPSAAKRHQASAEQDMCHRHHAQVD